MKTNSNDNVWRNRLLGRWKRTEWIAIVGIITLLLTVSTTDAQDFVQLKVAQNFELPANFFDQQVFGGGGNVVQRRRRIEAQASLQLEAIDAICDLTDAQKAKLQLAARGDMKRLLDEIDVVRQRFMKARLDQNAFNQVWQDIQPLKARLNVGPYDENSLFFKVVKQTLDSEQTAKYEQAELKRREFHYAATVALFLAMLEKENPLSHEQRQRFQKLLIEETKPPKKSGQYDYYVVMFQVAKIPEDKIRPIFDAAQWRALQRQVARGRGMQRILEQGGFLPE